MSEESKKSTMIGLSDDYDGYDLNISSRTFNDNHSSFVLLFNFLFGELIAESKKAKIQKFSHLYA